MLASLSGCVTDNGEKPDVIKHMENTDNQNWGMPTKFKTIKIFRSTINIKGTRSVFYFGFIFIISFFLKKQTTHTYE